VWCDTHCQTAWLVVERPISDNELQEGPAAWRA
jgi:hypothetical protein